MIEIPAPAEVNGDKLERELAAAGHLNVRVTLVPVDPPLLQITQDDHDAEPLDEAAIEAVVSAHHVGPTLSADADTVPADGASAVTVTYRHPDPATRPTSATFIVNGVAKEVTLTSAGNAFLDVVADAPGVITVAVESWELSITAEAV